MREVSVVDSITLYITQLQAACQEKGFLFGLTPEGYKLVPLKPAAVAQVSDEMVTAYLEAHGLYCLRREDESAEIEVEIDPREACRAALEAALAQPQLNRMHELEDALYHVGMTLEQLGLATDDIEHALRGKAGIAAIEARAKAALQGKSEGG
jgi:hypothetical protein